MSTSDDLETVEKVESTCAGLYEAKKNLLEAEHTADKVTTREMIKNEISRLQECINECETIASTLPNRHR